MVELAAINRRLKTVTSFLKTKHTTDTIERLIHQAENGLGDHTAAFVPIENTIVHGTKHMGALLQLAEMLEIKGEIGRADNVISECTALLERKVELLKVIYQF